MQVDGELPTSLGTLLTAPPNQGIRITSIEVVNDNGAAQTYTLYTNQTGTDIPITPIDAQLPIGAKSEDTIVRELKAGSLVKGVASDTDVTIAINFQVL
jgi:hypothetical protein